MNLKIIPWVLAAIIIILLLVLIFVPARPTNAPSGSLSGGVVPAATTTVSKNTPPPPGAALQSYRSAKGKLVLVNVSADQMVQSPLALRGQVAGWYFEGSFPVKITDANNKVLGQVAARATGQWTTPNPVPFTAKLVFATSSTRTGFLILHNDNPSGLSQNDDQIEIPVAF